MFFAGEPLLLSGGHNLTIDDQRGGRIVIKGRNSLKAEEWTAAIHPFLDTSSNALFFCSSCVFFYFGSFAMFSFNASEYF